MKAMLKRGIRVLPGGDYGFAWAPHGENAKDLEYFVKYLGMTPMETSVSATRWGGQIMMRQGSRRDPRGLARRPAAGRRRPARQHLDPAGQAKLLAIMKDGEFAKAPEIALARALGAHRR